MNNVVIVGVAVTDDYTRAIMNYTFPENLKIIIPKETNNVFLTKALDKLGLPSEIQEEEKILVGNPTLIIFFSKFINVTEVALLSDANKKAIDVIFIKPNISKLISHG